MELNVQIYSEQQCKEHNFDRYKGYVYYPLERR